MSKRNPTAKEYADDCLRTLKAKVTDDDARRHDTQSHYYMGVNIGSDGDTLVISYWRGKRLAGYIVVDSGRPTAVHRVQGAGRQADTAARASDKGAS